MKSPISNLSFLPLVLFLFACTTASVDLTPTECSIEQEIVVEQNSSSGLLTVWNDETNLYVHYQLTDNWFLQDSRVYISSCNAGNGQKPEQVKSYEQTFPKPSTTQVYTEIIPLSELKNCFCIQVKSNIVQNDVVVEPEFRINNITTQKNNKPNKPTTNDQPSVDSNWNWTTEYCIKNCIPKDKPEPNPTEDTCETAFASPQTGSDGCFLDTGLFQRWGWRLNLNKEELSNGNKTYPIWAGAGQCDQSKGNHVANLSVGYDSNSGNLTITATVLSGYSLDESHAWVGDQTMPWPTNGSGSETVAPGSYGNQHDLTEATSDTYTLDVSHLENDFYLIYHSVSCVHEDQVTEPEF